jgi:HEXXH motif-containing protein
MRSNLILGDTAAAPIIAISNRFRCLLREETNCELHAEYSYYTPWMAIRARRSELRNLISIPPSSGGPVLIRDFGALRIVAQACRGTHPLTAIVPHDIGASILLESDCLDEWAGSLSEAAELAAGLVPWLGRLLHDMLTFVVPIRHRPDNLPTKRGFSTPLCFGAIFLTFEDRSLTAPTAIPELVVDLAHELGHHALHTYQTADPLFISDLRLPVYSGVKRFERPAIMALHASAAIAYMVEMLYGLETLSSHSGQVLAWARIKRQELIVHQRQALSELRTKCAFTPVGERLIREFEEQLASSSAS